MRRFSRLFSSSHKRRSGEDVSRYPRGACMPIALFGTGREKGTRQLLAVLQ